MPSIKISSPKIIVFAILCLFTIKGVILSALVPIFQNPDEQVHYGTIQYLAEPKLKNWPIRDIKERVSNASDISTYGFSEETIRSAQATQFDEIKSEKQNIQNFTTLEKENEILTNNWQRYIDIYPENASGTKSIYYLVSSWLERLLSDESIFVRIFSMRLLAVLFGVGTIILAYLTARKIGLSEDVILLLTTILAFQPMFSITAAQVNIDIALIFSFSLFLYAGVCLLKDGLNWQRILLAISATILGLFSKGPGIVLVSMLYPLLAWMTYQKLQIPGKKFLIRLIGTTIILATSIIAIVPQSYWVSITNFTKPSAFHTPLESISQYLGKSLQTGELRDTTLSYWGHFGWLDHSIPEWSLAIIIMISIAGFSGALWYLFSRKKELNFLPERKYLFFLLSMIIALQVAIRFFDWRVFDYSNEILIGQPGRYFLPNITAHLIIIIVGLGFLLRKEIRFMIALKVLALAMILLQIHAILNVIIPRYYL